MAAARKTKSRDGTPDDSGFDSDEPELIDDGDIESLDDDDVEEITSDDIEEITGEYEPFPPADHREEATDHGPGEEPPLEDLSEETTGKHSFPSDAHLDLEPIGRRRRSRRAVRPRPKPEEDFTDEVDDTSPEQADRADDVAPWDAKEPDTGEAAGVAPGSDAGTPAEGPDDRDDDVRWSSMPQDRPSAMPDVGPTRVDVVNQIPGALDEKTKIFDDPDQPAEPEEPEAPFLVIVQGEEEGREIELLRDELTIGRGPDNDLVFPDIACSRRHAMLERRGDDWAIVDLGSGNGTLVNGERMQSEVLQDGDEIEIGNTVLQFNLPGAVPSYEEDDVYEKTPVPSSTTTTGAVALMDSDTGSFLTRLTADPQRRKLLKVGACALGGLLLLMLIVKMFVPSAPPEPTADEIRRKQAMHKRRELEKHMAMAKTLVVQKKWKDALLEVQMAKVYEPDSPIVKEYLSTVQREMAAASAMEQARMFIEQKTWDGAMAALARIPGDSEYRLEADRLKKDIDELISGSLVNEGLDLMREGKYNQALLKFDEVIRRNPDNEEVVSAKRRCEAEIDRLERDRIKSERESSRSRRRRRRSRVHKKPETGLTGQMLALYRNGEIERAIAKAESAGSSKNVVLMKQFRGTYEMGMQLAKQPGQADKAIKALKKAYSLDKKISGGNGKYYQKLKTVMAKVYFVMGVDSHTRRRFPEAYQAYKSALKYKPDHSLAKGRLRELEKVAKKFYEEAYVIKATNAEEAIKKLKIVMKIIPPDHVYYTKAKKLKTKIQGPLGDGLDTDDGF